MGMKLRNISLALAVMVLLAGCAKENLEPNDSVATNESAEIGDGNESVNDPGAGENPEVVMTFSAEGPDVKTTVSDLSGGNRYIYWSNGDQISLNGETSVALSDVGAGARRAEFEFTTNVPSPYYAVYPAVAWVDENGIVLPQTIGNGNIPMLGYSEEISGAVLKTNFAVLHFTLKKNLTDQATTISSVTVTSPTARLSGAFACDFAEGTFTPAASPTTDEKSITVTIGQALTSSSPVDVFVPMPAGTYAFSVTITDGRGDSMVMSTGSAKTFTAGIVKNFPDITYLHWDIDTDDKLVDFATTYNAGNGGKGTWKTCPSVKLTANLSFDATSSSAFNATGGIGTGGDVTNYFNGVFDGNDKTISGLSATVPLFAYSGSAGQIENVNLDNTCSLTIPAAATDVYHAAIVGRHKGTMSGCSSAASMSIQNIESVNTASQYYGLLVGRVYEGSVSDCSASGSIVCSQTGASLSVASNAAYMGGISAYMDGTGSSISSSDFTGSITISDGSSDYTGIVSSVDALYFYVGGIVGYASGTGSISYCNDSEPSGTPGSIDVRGTFVPGIGGVAGWVESTSCAVEHCNNYMSLSFKSSGVRTATSPCRVGGIAGRSKGDVSTCDNNGAISTICNSTSIYLGGIAGDGANISHCNNNVGGTITRTNQLAATSKQTNRYHYLGGIVGANVAEAEIEDCHNYAKILNNTPGVSENTTIDMGGIIGYVGTDNAEKINKATISECSNEGEVVLDNNVTTAVAITRTSLGGVVGYVDVGGAETKVSSGSNAGKIWCNNNASASYGPMCIGGTIGLTAAVSSIEDCANSGAILCSNVGVSTKTTVDLGGIVGWASATISITGTKPAAAQQYTQNSGTIDVSDGGSTAYARTSLGGIIGYGSGVNSTVSYCNNTAQVHCTYETTRTDGRISYIGGIVGVMASLTYEETDGTPKAFGGLDKPEVAYCNNTGAVWTQNYNNYAGNKTGAFAGGIVGAIAGNGGANRASIHDCTSSTGDLTIYRGNGGGIAAYTSRSSLSKNTASQTITGNKNATDAAGIVGTATNATSISDCTFTGSVGAAQNVAGICYSLDGTSSISECKVNGATLTKGTLESATEPAVLVSTAASGATITDCGVKGTLKGAAITLDSNMVTNNSGTITGTYLIE